MRLSVIKIDSIDYDAAAGRNHMVEKLREDAGLRLHPSTVHIGVVLQNGHWFMCSKNSPYTLRPIPPSMQGCVIYAQSKKTRISLFCTATGVISISTIKKALNLDSEGGVRILTLIFENWEEYFKDEDFKGMLEDGTLQTIIDIWDL